MLEKNLQLPKNNVPGLKAENGWMAGNKDEKRRTHDLYDALESVAWLWRFSGVFPMTVEKLAGMKRYKTNKIFAAYSVLLLSLRVANFIYFTINFDAHFGRGPLRLTAATTVIRAIGNIMCMFASTVFRIPQLTVLSESIDTISEQDSFLNKMNCRSNYASTVKIIRACVWTSLLAVSSIVLYDINCVYHNKDYVWAEYALWYAGLLVQSMDLTVLMILVGFLGSNFHNLNKKIRTVIRRANASSPKVLVTSNVCAEQLRLISEIHYNICAVGKRINRIFDWDVIINVIIAFIVLSTTLYYIFYEVQRSGPTDIPQIFAYINWELYHSIPILTIVVICNLTSYQSAYAGQLIHEIRVENTDSELYQALKSFSLQLHHQKLEFNAGGFFPIDSSLLQTMIGKITTYLVILIQFNPKLD